MTSLFHRGTDLPVAERADGCWVIDRDGNQYLDAAGGALVVGIGHGARSITEAIDRQMEAFSYVHASAFTSAAGELYASQLAARLPMDDPSIFPVSGGSEAVETALKVARAYHLANGEPQRAIVIGREISYHGNTRGALDVSGRASLREPYLPWLGAAGRVPGVLEYRCPNPDHPESCATWHAARLEDEIARLGRDQVAAFIAEPVGGAASGAAAPPQGYWEAMTEVCRSHGVLVIADEVMTGFGRTGRWFASEHFGLVPDVMTLAKGASSGYWPLGVCAFSGRITQALRSAGFIHGLTFSHHPVGAAVGLAVIAAIEELSLVEAARVRGAELLAELAGALSAHPHVGDVRGLGLMIAVELVEDRDSKRPFPTSADVAANAALLCREQGLLVYPSTGCAGGGRGDLLMIGPPLTISRDEVALITSMLPRALERL
jgi:hypothetical protein